MPAASEYVELRCRSAFSFLDGASLPEDLAEAAARQEMDTLALVDRDGVYGAPRFAAAARRVGIRPLVGADVTLADGPPLLLLVENKTGYRNLCRLLTRAREGLGKADPPRATRALLAEHAAGLIALGGAAPRDGSPRALRRRSGGRTSTWRCSATSTRARPGMNARSRRRRRRRAWGWWRPTTSATRRRGSASSTTSSPARAKNAPSTRSAGACCRTASAGSSRRARWRRSSPIAPPPSGPRARSPSAVSFRSPISATPSPGTPCRPARRSRATWRSCARPASATATPRTIRCARRCARSSARELGIIGRLGLAGYFLLVWDIVRGRPAEEHHDPGARLGGELGGLLRPRHHRRRSGEDGAAVRALPVGGAGAERRQRRRPHARHRSRSAVGRRRASR